jgi:UDP-N-acetylglucosamine diphosphorylase/glucosamine-1-phosphate N-acetyltransferase
MIVLLLEDDRADALSPSSSTRPVFELRTGALNLRERVRMVEPTAHVRAVVRPFLQPLLEAFDDLAQPFPADHRIVVLNGRLAVSFDRLRDLLTRAQPGAILDAQGRLIAAWLDPGVAVDGEDCVRAAATVPAEARPDDVTLFEGLWEMVHANRAALQDDAEALRRTGSPVRRLFGIDFADGSARPAMLRDHEFDDPSRAIVYPGVHLLSPDQVLLGPGVKILPGAVLDAEGGPIVLGSGCRIAPNVTLEGPLYLGPGTSVNPGAKLREGTSAGAFCKLGGEIEDSILLDLSNKQHEGFLGHAYLGSWVNLGADTNGSDLKNTYGRVRVDLGEGPIDTGHTFVGPVLGDHAKTGINTMLSTGAVVGVAANVFGSGFPPKFVPAFTWGGYRPWVEYRLDQAMQTARTVMARRDVIWTSAHRDLFAHVFEQTRRHRA